VVQQKFGVTLSLASVGAMLARLNLTPQKPLQRNPGSHRALAA
jgi:transposase